MAQETRDTVVTKRTVKDCKRGEKPESMNGVDVKITDETLKTLGRRWSKPKGSSSRNLFCWSRNCKLYFLSFGPIKLSKLEA